MTQQEIEKANRIHTMRMDAIDARLDRVAEMQEANAEQIARNTEGIVRLRNLMEKYFRRLRDVTQ